MFDEAHVRVGYVVKRYPRYSETFIVNEILAHERAECDLQIYALRPPADQFFQDCISRVRAPVTYLPFEKVKGVCLWEAMQEVGACFESLWATLANAGTVEAQEVFQAIALAKHVRSQNIEHLHAHFATSAANVARLAAQITGIPYTVTAHAKDIYHESVQGDDLRRKLIDAAAVVTVSDFNVRHLCQTLPEMAGCVHRIYNGLCLDGFPYEAPRQRAPTIVAVGRLVEKKGFADLIDACAHLAKNGTSFSCQIIGTGELQDSLQSQIEQAGLSAVVRLIGPRPQSDVIRLVQSASVLAAPCVVGSDGNRDGLPTVLLEAMALGTPCIATDVTGIPEIIRDGQTGLLVEPGNPRMLAEKLTMLLARADLRVRLAAAARELIEESFNIDDNAQLLRNLFARSRAGVGELEPVLQETA